MIIFISLLILSIIAFFIHISMSSKPLTSERLVELLLLYQLVFSLGLTSVLAFFGLTFMGEYVAKYTGWPYSPFEQQLGNVNLGYGVLGILCIWYRGTFWIATILGFSIWILGDGIHHFLNMMVDDNYAPGNIGIPMITDFAVPVILLILLYWHLKFDKPQLSTTESQRVSIK